VLQAFQVDRVDQLVLAFLEFQGLRQGIFGRLVGEVGMEGQAVLEILAVRHVLVVLDDRAGRVGQGVLGDQVRLKKEN